MNEKEKAAIVYIPGDKLFPHPDNPRKDLGDLTELSESIKAKGILQNLTVVPRADDGYTIVIGHRRWAAGNKAGLTEFPCVISDMPEAEQIQTMLLENMQRSDLSIVEQAFGFQMMLDLGNSVADISEKTGFSETTVRRRVKLLELDHEKLKAIEGVQFSLSDLDKLNKIESVEARNELLADLGTNNFNFKFSNALSKQKRDKEIRQAMEYLDSIGIKGIKEFDRKEYRTERYINVSEIKSEYTTKFFDEFREKGVELFYVESYYSICIVSGINEETADEAEARERERQRDSDIAHRRREVMAAANQNMYSLRFNFIRLYTKTNAKKHIKELSRFFATIVAQECYQFAGDGLCELLNITNDEDEIKQAADSAAEYSPELLMVYCIYSILYDNKGLGYFNQYSPNEFYAENEQLDDIYDFLTAIGYVMSDSEAQLRNGTSPLFNPDNMVYKLEDEPDKAVPVNEFLTDVRTYNAFKRCGVTDSEDLIKKEQEGKLSDISDAVYARAVEMAQEHGVELPRRNTVNEGEVR